MYAKVSKILYHAVHIYLISGQKKTNPRLRSSIVTEEEVLDDAVQRSPHAVSLSFFDHGLLFTY